MRFLQRYAFILIYNAPLGNTINEKNHTHGYIHACATPLYIYSTLTYIYIYIYNCNARPYIHIEMKGFTARVLTPKFYSFWFTLQVLIKKR